MRAATKRLGHVVSSRQKARHQVVARAAGRMVELLEDRQLLSNYFVNFTAGLTPVDEPGYMTDIGSQFGDRADRGNAGVSYGWVAAGSHTGIDNTASARNRNSTNHPTYPYSPDLELYDSLLHMQKTPPGNASWEIAVPNGTYVVHAASADPTSTTAGDSHHVILAEGTLVYDYNELAGGGNHSFAEGTVLATVADGNLTISTGAGSVNAKLAFVEITPYTNAAPTVAPTIAISQQGANVVLSWFGSPHALSYNIYRGTSSGGEALIKSGVTATNFIDTTPAPGTDFYRIVPVNPAGTGPNSNEVSVSPIPPAAPTIAVTQVGGSAALTWNANSAATSYNIYRGTAAGNETLIKSGVTTNSYTDPTIVAGANFFYVRGVNAFGTGPNSNEVSLTPVAPTDAPGLSVTTNGATASLSWAAVPFASSYNIYRGTDTGNEVLVKTGVTALTYDDLDATNATPFYYIIPVNVAGVGPQSNEASAFLIPPFTAPILTEAPASGKVTLTWPADLYSGKFDIYRGTTSGGETLIKTGAVGTTYSDTTVTIGTQYYYYIIPTSGAGPGPQSNELAVIPHATYVHVNFQTPSSVTPAGYLPDIGQAYADRGNTFSYGWWNSPNATTNAAPTADTANRERNNAASPDKRYDTFDHFHNATSPAGNNWWEIAVPNGTYQVRVVGGEASNADEFLAFQAEANKDPVTGQPLIDGSGVQLLAQDMTGTTGVARWADSGFITVVVTDGNLTISDGPGFANTKIDFIDIDTINVATTPASPTGLTINNVHASNLTLNWQDASTNETGFRIEQSTDGTTFTPLTTVSAQTGTGADSYVVAGLASQTQYFYRIFALNLQGDSAAPTNTANTTTLVATGGVAGRINNTTGDVNLTSEGTLDWAHWGQTTASTFDHKSPVVSLISDVTPISGSTKVQMGGSPTTFTWSDGTPNATVNASGNELGTFAFGHGFTFTVPADTTQRALRVYVGVNNVRGQLTARLSDGSAPDYVDTSLFNATAADGVYTLAYSAASAGQTLLVSWVEFPPDGDQVAGRLNLKAATLQLAPAGVPTGTTTLAASSLNSGRNSLTWNVVTNVFGYNIERAPDVGGVPGDFATLATLDSAKSSYFDKSTLGLAGVKYYYRVTPYNVSGQTGSVSNIVSTTTPAGPFGDGAQATYFTYAGAPPAGNDPAIGDIWPTTSIDPTINFDWGTGAPAGAGANFPVDNFMTHWTFKLKPEFTETYTFFADTDDGYRLIVNGQQILNGLSRRGGVGTQFASTPITLVAGQTYDVVFDQIEQGGSAGAKLSWQSASLPREIIPQAVMFHTAPDVVPPKVTSIDVDGALPAGYTYTPAQHLIVHFSKAVDASQNFLNVTVNSTDFSTSLSGAQVDVKFDVASNTALITFPNLGNTPLPDANYSISIDPSGVSDFSGNLLDGNGDGSAGDAYTGTFYVFTGDSQVFGNGVHNADRKVDFGDFQILEQNFGKVATDRPTGSEGDFNHDGVVDRLDLQIFNQQYLKTFAPPAPAAPVPSPVPVVPSKPTTTPPVVSKPAPVSTAKPAAVPQVAAAPLPVVNAKPTAITKPVTSIKPVVVTKPPVVAKPVIIAPPSAFSAKRLRGVTDWLSSN